MNLHHLNLMNISFWNFSALSNMIVFSPASLTTSSMSFSLMFLLSCSLEWEHLWTYLVLFAVFVKLWLSRALYLKKKKISLISSLFLLFLLWILTHEFLTLNLWSHFKASNLSFKIVSRYFYLHEMLLC